MKQYRKERTTGLDDREQDGPGRDRTGRDEMGWNGID